jgi:hypothetical protein
MTNAVNDTTGTVHIARHDGHGLVQVCGIQRVQTLFLRETAEAVTCKRCLARKAPAARKVTPTAPATESKSTTWGVFSPAGNMTAYAYTRKDAMRIIGRLESQGVTGYTTRKI